MDHIPDFIHEPPWERRRPAGEFLPFSMSRGSKRALGSGTSAECRHSPRVTTLSLDLQSAALYRVAATINSWKPKITITSKIKIKKNTVAADVNHNLLFAGSWFQMRVKKRANSP